MQVTFFGVRGSCPCAGDKYRRVGGNTSCVLVTIDGEAPLILDLGTGLRALGVTLESRQEATGMPLRATALLTHLHYDHILGLPFFGPLRDPAAGLSVLGPTQEDASLNDTLRRVVRPPFFPVEMGDFRGDVCFQDLNDEDFAVGGAKVRCRSVPHLGHTLGFRIEAGGRTLAYIPDHQAPPDQATVPESVLELCDGADLLLHDAQYTEDEYVEKADWGHSTVPYAVHVAAEAGVRQLGLLHHDPAHTDRDIDDMVERGRQMADAGRVDAVFTAVEGGTVDLDAIGPR